MKLYGFVRTPAGDRLIHVWDALRLKDDGPRQRFYSTQRDPARRLEMVPVSRDGTLFFRYLALGEGESAPSGQTLTHLMAKEILAGLRCLRLHLPEGEVRLWVRGWQTEQRIIAPGGEVYYADLSAQVWDARPRRRVRHWGQRVILEITVTHPTPPEKVAALARMGYAVIEVPIPDELIIPEQVGESEERVISAERRLTRALVRGFAARILTEPQPRRPLRRLWRRFVRFMEEIIAN